MSPRNEREAWPGDAPSGLPGWARPGSGCARGPDPVELPLSRVVRVHRVLGIGSKEETVEETGDAVTVEFRVTISANGTKVASMVCSPGSVECLAVGHLVCGGHLRGGDRVTGVRWDPGRSLVEVGIEEEGGSRAAVQVSCLSTPVRAGLRGGLAYPVFSAGWICDIMDHLLGASSLFAETGGCHSAALCGPGGIVFRHDDIGRHNAVDKAVGHAVLSGVSLGDKMLAITGRISSDIMAKIVFAGIPVIASKAPPTDVGIAMAEEYGVTLVGFVRGRRLTVYAHRERIEEAKNAQSSN